MFGEYLKKLMFEKINNPELDLDNAHIFGCEKDVFRSYKKDRYNKIELNKEWWYKDVTGFILRPLKKMTRREIKAFKELLENPEDKEAVKEWNPIIAEDAAWFDQFEEKNKELLKESLDYLATRHNKEILRKYLKVKFQSNKYLVDTNDGVDYEELLNRAKD